MSVIESRSHGGDGRPRSHRIVQDQGTDGHMVSRRWTASYFAAQACDSRSRAVATWRPRSDKVQERESVEVSSVKVEVPCADLREARTTLDTEKDVENFDWRRHGMGVGFDDRMASLVGPNRVFYLTAGFGGEFSERD